MGVQGIVDSIFAQAEAAAAGKPVVIFMLKAANQFIDSWLTSIGIKVIEDGAAAGMKPSWK
jgi:mitochondrial fission protein ELM1